MTPNQVFSMANGLALAAWLLLIVLPRQRWVTGVLAPVAMPAVFAATLCRHHRDAMEGQCRRILVTA